MHKTGTTLTYAQLHDSVQSISSQLLIPLQRGDTVVILCSPGLELVEFLFGCQRGGLLSVPIFPPDPSFAKENYHYLVRVLSQTKPKAAIAHRDYITSVQRYVSSSSIDTKLAHMLQSLKWISTNDIKDKNEVYLVQYTSGATRIPKPVLVTAGSAAHNVRTARKAYSSPGASVKRPRLWLELISEFKATCTPVPSFTLPLVVKRGGIDKGSQPINLWSLRSLIIINELSLVFKPFGLSPSFIAPSYGLAENCTFVSMAWKRNSPVFPDILTHNKLLPAARLALRCEDEEDMDIIVMKEETYEPVEDGIEGEIWVSSPSNASGYLGHPFLTCKVFHGRLNGKNSKCFVRTGDRGIVMGEERYLFVTGRCSDVIKLHNTLEIHPHYIETTAYNSCPKFLRGGCLAAFEISDTIVLVSELQRSEHDVRFLRSICEGIRKRVLEEEKVELGYVVLVGSGSLPKTTSGKIQRWAAKAKLMEAKMSIVMDIRYGECRRGQEKRKVATGKREEIFHSLSSSRPSRPSLLSLL
ncbi:hypothetical protein I3760_16G059300 [Carya illinoinensis]|nr:hypothetical protein I3760_16G059300 [Carya illinoinensis]